MPEFLNKLDKDYILNNVSEEEIFKTYMGISEVVLDSMICSPLRTDNNPTCSFYYGKDGRLRFRDFAGYFWGDCFDLVAYKLSLNPYSPKEFNILLHDIARTFRVHLYADSRNYNKSINNETFLTLQKRKESKFTSVHCKFRQWNYYDESYWKRIYVTLTHAKRREVFPIQEVYLNQKCIYIYNQADPCFCFFIGRQDGTNEPLLKLYFPYRDKEIHIDENGKEKVIFRKFLTNNSKLLGLRTFIPNKFGIICKSFKDALSIDCLLAKHLPISTLALPSENHILTKEEFNSFRYYCDYWISFLDYDNTGITTMTRLRREFGITPIAFTDNTLKRKVGYHGFKDFTDWAEKTPEKEIIETCINYFFNHINIEEC